MPHARRLIGTSALAFSIAVGVGGCSRPPRQAAASTPAPRDRDPGETEPAELQTEVVITSTRTTTDSNVHVEIEGLDSAAGIVRRATQPGEFTRFAAAAQHHFGDRLMFDNGTEVLVVSVKFDRKGVARYEAGDTSTAWVAAMLKVHVRPKNQSLGQAEGWLVYTRLVPVGSEPFRWQRCGVSWGVQPEGVPAGLEALDTVGRFFDEALEATRIARQ